MLLRVKGWEYRTKELFIMNNMKKFIIVPDSFKGTLSSKQICEIIRERILIYYPKAEILSFPVADGGEGSVDCFFRRNKRRENRM